MRKLFLSAAVAIGSVAVGGQVTADAAPPAAKDGLTVAQAVFSSRNPEGAYKALSSSQRSQFDSAETPASVGVVGGGSGTFTPSDGGQPAIVSRTEFAHANLGAGQRSAYFSGTFSDSSRWGAKAVAGNTLYTWYQATRVTISSGRVTGVTVYNYGYETSTPGWRTGGISTATYNAGWEGRGLVHAKFVLGVAGWDVQHTDNCGQIRLNADANHYLINSSCDLN